MRLTEHPLWSELEPFIITEDCTRDGKKGRKRIELTHRIKDGELLERFRAIEINCCNCNNMIHPIRRREDKSVYIGVTCPLAVNITCARTKKASNEYIEIISTLEKTRDKDTSIDRLHGPEERSFLVE